MPQPKSRQGWMRMPRSSLCDEVGCRGARVAGKCGMGHPARAVIGRWLLEPRGARGWPSSHSHAVDAAGAAMIIYQLSGTGPITHHPAAGSLPSPHPTASVLGFFQR